MTEPTCAHEATKRFLPDDFRSSTERNPRADRRPGRSSRRHPGSSATRLQAGCDERRRLNDIDRTGDIADATNDRIETVWELDETVQRATDELEAKGLVLVV